MKHVFIILDDLFCWPVEINYINHVILKQLFVSYNGLMNRRPGKSFMTGIRVFNLCHGSWVVCWRWIEHSESRPCEWFVSAALSSSFSTQNNYLVERVRTIQQVTQYEYRTRMQNEWDKYRFECSWLQNPSENVRALRCIMSQRPSFSGIIRDPGIISVMWWNVVIILARSSWIGVNNWSELKDERWKGNNYRWVVSCLNVHSASCLRARNSLASNTYSLNSITQ